MDKYIKELQEEEVNSIINTMAFMSYNPSIGRVLQKGGVKEFQRMAVTMVSHLREINSMEKFDLFHKKWMNEFLFKIKTNAGNKCSYGQGQKAINVFLKLYVDWAKLPKHSIAMQLLPFLHVPLDKIIMKTLSKVYSDYWRQKIKPLHTSTQQFSLSKINERLYYTWQSFFREKHPSKPMLFDIAWAINR
jgi:hypothetical protein